MSEYYIEWRIEIDADNPEEAAREARQIQTNPDSTAVVFHVFGEGVDDETVVDLEEFDD